MAKLRFQAGLLIAGASVAAGACGAEGGYDEPPTDYVTQAVPLAPVLISPSRFGTSDPAYVWQPSAGATSYRLWVNDTTTTPGGFKINQVFTATEAGCPAGTEPSCTITTGIALAPGLVRWWVQAIDATGAGPWSSLLAFNASASSTFSLISPTGTINDSTPTYTWNAAAGAPSYTLQVIDTTGTKINTDFSPTDAGCAGGGVCSVTPTTTIANGAARWYIKPGPSAAWSSPLFFTVDLCSTPCDDGNPCTTDTCATAAGCTFTPVTDGTACVDNSSCTTAEYCNDGKCGVRSGDAEYASCTPVAIGPSGDLGTNHSPTYSWNAVANPASVGGFLDRYRLWIADSTAPSGGFSFIQEYSATAAGCAAGGTCAVTPSFSLANGEGKWWVQSPPWGDELSPQGADIYMHGPYSTESKFSIGTTARPVLVSPITGTATASPTYTWNAVPGTGNTYRLLVDDSVTVGKVDVNLTESACSGGVCSHTPAVTLASGAVKWWVQANPDAGMWSLQGNFLVP